MKGRCLCNAVQYELHSEVQDSYYCHCRNCQILSGSAFQVLGTVQRGSIDIICGELIEYQYKTDSGFKMTRQICSKCGTPLFSISSRFPEIQMFMISTLDKPESVKPSFQIWGDSKVKWSNIGVEICSFPRGASDGES